MQVDYAPFIDRVIQRYEGPYGWNKRDPGGPTKYGITCYDLAEHRGQAMKSMADWAPLVKAMTLQEAEEIYATKYAARLAFNALQPGCDTVILDYGINSGYSRAIRVARTLVGKPGNDLVFDAELVTAVNATNAKTFVDAMCKERLAFMHAIRNGSAWAEFGHGWQSRVDDLQAYSDHLAAGAHPLADPPAKPVVVGAPKATNPQPKSTTAGTVASTPPVIVAAHEAGLPWYGVAAVAAAVLIGGVAYEIWQANKANTANLVVHA